MVERRGTSQGDEDARIEKSSVSQATTTDDDPWSLSSLRKVVDCEITQFGGYHSNSTLADFWDHLEDHNFTFSSMFFMNFDAVADCK